MNSDVEITGQVSNHVLKIMDAPAGVVSLHCTIKSSSKSWGFEIVERSLDG